MNILLTGYTGNLGTEIAARLAPHRVLALVREPALAPGQPHVELVLGTLEALPEHLAKEVEVVVHSAALTAFRAPQEELHRVNVEGTARLLQWARGCPRLRKFLHLSTTCVVGRHTGELPEAPLPERPDFVNGYEESKWEAEQLVLGSGLPTEVARLSIVAGSADNGDVRRPGALHHTLYWLYKGLIPLLPGTSEAPVDVISTEFAAAAVTSRALAPLAEQRVWHVAAGAEAPRLGELLEFLAGWFARHHRGWASGAMTAPSVVDAETFAMFEASVRQAGDALFLRVCGDAQSFLPALLHPRTVHTSAAWPMPPAPWRTLTERVCQHQLTTRWQRPL